MTARTIIGGPPDPERPDGRQSRRAADIARGTRRMLHTLDLVCLAEFTLPNQRRADLLALSQKNRIWIVEIKSSLADFQVDQKWPEYRDYCDEYYFAVADDFPQDVLPDDTGLIVADRFGAQILRNAPQQLLGSARRKALTLRLARTSISRLQAILDPENALEPHGSNR